MNDTIRLHGVIHEVNPDAVALAHPPEVVTLSTLRTVPDVYDQESCFLAGALGIVEENYSGLASTEERVRPFPEGLRKYPAVILPNHGAADRTGNRAGHAPRTHARECPAARLGRLHGPAAPD